MSLQKFPSLMIGVSLIVFLLVGCVVPTPTPAPPKATLAPADTSVAMTATVTSETPAPAPPTATRISPTPTPTPLPSTAVPIAKPASSIPTYSQVLQTYPEGVRLCQTELSVVAVSDAGEWSMRGTVEVSEGKRQFLCYGVKYTLEVPVTIGGKTYPPGTKLTVDENLQWVEVSSWDGTSLKPTPTRVIPTTTPTSVPNAVVEVNALNLRAGPGTNYPILDTVRRGDSLHLLGQHGNCAWLKVTAPQELTGWVSGQYVTLNVPCDSIPPAAVPTPIPSTRTSACEVKCDIDAEKYRIEITCESGQMAVKVNDTTSFEYDDVGRRKAVKVQLDQERTYENTGNTYKIAGDISIGFEYGDAGQVVNQPVNYRITVTGGVFGEVPQICER